MKSGSSTVGLNAEMKSESVITSKSINTWSELESTVCSPKKSEATAAETADELDDTKTINESEIVDNDDEDEYDEDVEDDGDDDDSDSEEVITKDSLIAEEIDVIKGMNDRINNRKFGHIFINFVC